MVSDLAVDASLLNVRIAGTKVLDGFSLQVKRGEVIALLGPNGSGKTTFIRTLLGFYAADSGTVRIHFPKSDNTNIGYLPEERGLYRKESSLQLVRYFSKLKAVSRAEEVFNAWVTEFQLEGILPKRVDQLSGGQQQRLQLAIALLGNPSLIILDEPTKGFDPIARELLHSAIRRRRAEGAAILLVSHDMDEVAVLADRIAFLNEGQVAIEGSLQKVRQAFVSEHRFRVAHTGEIPETTLFRQEIIGTEITDIFFEIGLAPQEMLAHLIEIGVQVREFEDKAPTLAEIYTAQYGGAR
ncbi:ABC-2 type transport system ATP-binding protein [Aurantimicrobium minutum]|uniref:ABC transporter ATP-binding protein n=1 Tax=Aurantimicrobium minutum TaxID=708131 RepID=UPI00247618B1|nr:ABC transporter ATP-binding protein [Aurantimicrobium minutum]MDH6277780.1 ABC-2 type transport system ATP-binding protein [Aurantimicrobium minutum]